MCKSNSYKLCDHICITTRSMLIISLYLKSVTLRKAVLSLNSTFSFNDQPLYPTMDYFNRRSTTLLYDQPLYLMHTA